MYNPERHHRHSIRLRGYQYDWPGMYFVTVCTHLKRCLFGEIVRGQMVLNESGRLAAESLLRLPTHFSGLRIDIHVIMPNHAHAILAFRNLNADAAAPTLGAVIRHWKAASCHLIRSNTDPCFGWQRNYYERILRNDAETDRIRRYIEENPQNWDRDEERPSDL